MIGEVLVEYPLFWIWDVTFVEELVELEHLDVQVVDDQVEFELFHVNVLVEDD